MDEGTGDGEPATEGALAPIVAELGGRAGAGHPGREDGRTALVQDFARAVLRRIAPAQLRTADPVAAAAAVADAFELVDLREPDERRVRILDPATAPDGGRPAGTIVQVTCEDRQFIVSSVTAELRRLGYAVARELHPVFGTERGPDGRLTAIVAARSAACRESFVQVEVAGRIGLEARPSVVASLQAVLADVFAATSDYGAMREQVDDVTDRTRVDGPQRFPAEEVAEAADLLEWLVDGNFVLVGSCRFRPGEEAAFEGLGVLSRSDATLRRRPVPAAAELLRIGPTAVLSTVHRQVPVQRVDIAVVGPGGRDAGTFRLVGVFTAKANAEPAALTPVLRYKLRQILELEDVVERSQDEVALVSLFQVLPKDQLFDSSVHALRTLLSELLAAEGQHVVRVLVRTDPENRMASAVVAVPAEMYSPALRHSLEEHLSTRLGGGRVDTDVALGDRPEAILRLVAYLDGELPALQPELLERELRQLCRTWDEQLALALEARGPVPGGRAGDTSRPGSWAEWFPPAYRQAVTAAAAVDDVVHLAGLLAGTKSIRVALSPDPAGGAGARLKVFTIGGEVELSRFLPLVESLGLWAVGDRPYVLGGGDAPVHLHDFGVTDPTGATIDLDRDGPRLAAAAVALWEGRAEVDSLNRLVVRGGLDWEDVALLRAYRRYRSQVGTTFTTSYVDQVLVEHPAIASGVVDLFGALFDPVRNAGPEVVAELRQRVLDGCDAVARLDHDRILRGFLTLVDATLRTNRYVAPGDHLALKFDSAAVPGMPRPVPFREIFVHGPAVEGVHLRWGPVARGGIRWSDRPDDYRSEVLGLMRAQVLKNAVIVPTGAKGGFVVKRPAFGTRTPVDSAGAYEVFVSSMLQVTDNVVGDRVASVARRRDGDDTYLVVAADRGTATFSDLANRISRERGFWLDDAFASGGSSGYDHKRLGITARGAWVAAHHHFAELGIDLRSEQVSVVGIGDMSGDVFGNAMLRSERLRLVAAFDHRDIFIDPDPDPAASHRERARLFALPRSSWQDYDRALLSPGGGVWSRLEKSIVLSEQARAALRVDVDELTATEVIRSILQAPVDLLFTGGIGTFVRSAAEPDHDIDDKANADVRVEASSVRARVVVEGANLALTQRARIEYARRGGRVNTDAIDNAAAVDISDHEVNLKILLRLAVEGGELNTAERDRVLQDVCDDVVASVLGDCALQGTALSRAQALSPSRMAVTELLLEELESAGVVDRAVEALPTPQEMKDRTGAGAGLTRPELAVLLAGAKRSLVSTLLRSGVPDQPALREALVSYFPASLAGRFDHLLDRHRLRRELVASVVANDVVNRMGATFVARLSADTGAAAPAVAAAYWIARGVVDAPSYWERLHTAAGGDSETAVPAPTAFVAAAPGLSDLLEALTRTYLRRGEADGIAGAVDRDRSALAELAAAVDGLGSPYRRRLRSRRADTLVDGGLDPSLAVEWAGLPELEIGPDAAALARMTGRSIVGVAEAVLQLGESLGLDRLRDRLRLATPAGRWGRAAWRGLADDLDDLRRAAAERALQDRPELSEPDAVLRFLADRSKVVGEVTRLLREVEDEPEPSFDAIAVAAREVRRAIG